MSGHSKWHKIQHKKGTADAKRGNLFTKLTKAITVAAQQGGGDPEMNFSLRLAIERAKAGNVPKDNIERAIKRGTGELKEGAEIQEVIYEGYGPGGIAILIEAITDNTNRTVGEVKHTLGKYGGSLGGPGSVKWQFEQLGVIRFQIADFRLQNDEFELSIIDAGASDIIHEDEYVEIRCPKEKFQKVLDAIESFDIKPEDSSLEWVAKEENEVGGDVSKKMENLYDALQELDDVEEVYTNEA